ncbi:MAG: flagellar hook-basal body complex protein FliE [Firmicutes bacterium]|nr:flagellar hook-basal body complex protein FliE [Bacillota bacterium]
MRVSTIISQSPIFLRDLASRPKDEELAFAGALKKALDSVDTLEKDAERLTEALIRGEPSVEIHDVVLAAEKARLALDLTVSIRNKLVEAYQEIMRMQI